MKKTSKAQKALLKRIASTLPPEPIEKFEDVPWLGADLRLTGVDDIFKKQGKKLEPDKIYMLPVPVIGEFVNHEERLQKAYQIGGLPTVQQYVNKYNGRA